MQSLPIIFPSNNCFIIELFVLQSIRTKYFSWRCAVKGIIPEVSSLALEPPGYRMKYYRLKKGLTQKELAEKCGLSEPAIRNYELGNRAPDDEHRSLIAEALGVSFFAISEPDISKLFGAIHVLFDMEKIYDLTPVVSKKGKHYLAFPKDTKDSSDVDYLKKFLAVWADMRKKLDDGEIGLETYVNWQAQYPEQIMPKSK